MPIWGWCARRYGPRGMLMVGFTGCGAATVPAGLSRKRHPRLGLLRENPRKPDEKMDWETTGALPQTEH